MWDRIKPLYNTEAIRRLIIAMEPKGKGAFVDSLPPGARLLDVGCGNNSPMQIKLHRPDIYYVGLDIGDYNQTTPEKYADRYILTIPERFTAAIGELGQTMDAVVSSHNIEHCFDPEGTLEAMLDTLKPGGRIYLSFPSEASANLPHRKGCLNFYDDPTHRTLPGWDGILETLSARGFSIDYATRRYRPLLPALIGAVCEPVCALTGTQVPLATWALYGFESIIRASKG